MLKILIGLFILNFSCKSPSQETDKNKLDLLLNALETNQLANGSMALSRNGHIEYQKELGFAFKSLHKKTLTTPETRYRIGSVSKMFTATIIFQLVEEKKLRLDDNLAEFIPDIPNARSITIETLLRHRSGLANYTDEPEFNNWKYKSKPLAELLQSISNTTPKFTPGSKADYSNTNFVLLSYIIEKVCKKPFQEVVTERILSKINVKNTYFECASDSGLKNCKSYKYLNSEWIQQTETVASNHLGAGALVSTATDLVTFADALFTHKLLTPQSLQLMTSFQDDYGMGLFKISYNNIDTAWGHEGRIDEFYTSLIHYPKDNITIAYCTNGILYPRDDIMRKVSNICLNNPTTIPGFEFFSTSAQQLNQLAGKYSSMQISVDCKPHGDKLIVTTQGQDFDTQLLDKNYFANLQFGYFFEFIPTKNQLIIKETDNNYLLNKKK
ncbi:MAG: beta-lactamase family protein [Prolixibacteraceae bacterium]|nr:beta-lactamase family protein [Prolixibacteraceae bacterium]MBN2636037.1 beta-lactamase family protein [Prolixibacteraceae bacterium]